MLFYLFLLFTLVPLIEVVVLVQIGRETEWWVPLILVIVTGIVGAALARWQGWRAIERIRADAQAGRVPTDSILDGLLIFIAGLFLITPGVLSDVLGIALLISPLRALVKRGVAAWIRRNFAARAGRAGEQFWQSGDQSYSYQPDVIVDAKVVRTHVENPDRISGT